MNRKAIWRPYMSLLSAWLLLVAPNIGCIMPDWHDLFFFSGLGAGTAMPVPEEPSDEGGREAPEDGTGTAELLAARITDPASLVAGVVVSGDDTLALLAEKDSSGNVQKPVGATYYVGAEGEAITVWVGDDGLPASMVVGGWLFAFSDWTDSTVDVLVKAPNGTTVTETGVALPPEAQNYLTLLNEAQAAKVAQSSKLSDLGFWGLVEEAAYWIGVGTCIVVGGGLALAPEPITTAGGVALVAACAGPMISTVGKITQNEEVEDVGTVVSIATCTGGGCVPSVAGGVAGVVQKVDEHEATLDEQLANPLGQSLIITPEPSKPDAGESVTVTVELFPVLAGISLDYEVSGTDGYFDSGTILTDLEGRIRFTVPGALAGVVDTVTVTWRAAGIVDVATYTFGTGASAKHKYAQRRGARVRVETGTRLY